MLPTLAPLTTGSQDLVLDLGCGDGRHQEILEHLGYGTIGLDLSQPLLDLARSRLAGQYPARLVRGDMRRLPLVDNSVASVLSLFTAFGYFGPPAANGEPVREIARVLVPGGHWFLDYFDGDRVRGELGDGKPRVRERELGPVWVREEREFLIDLSQVAKKVSLRPRPGQEREAATWGVSAEGLNYTEAVAVFTLQELDEMAAFHGLTRVVAAGGYDGVALGEGTRWILVFRKDVSDSKKWL
jgi:SAM-dependent methyltransferase